MKKNLMVLLVVTLVMPTSAFAKRPKKSMNAADASLSVSVISIKYKGAWTEVQVALENKSSTEAMFECCKAFIQNTAGYSIASLTQNEMQVLVRNKVRTASIVGAVVGAGIGIAGAVSGNDDLVYAGTGVAGASTIAGAVGEAAADAQRRNVVIDDVMRAKVFYPGIKVAGAMWFPARKKWQGSKKAQAIDVIYTSNGQMQKVTVPITN